jgi:hypothetical protein
MPLILLGGITNRQTMDTAREGIRLNPIVTPTVFSTGAPDRW